MKLFRLSLAVVFIVAFTLIGCSEDETTPTDAPSDGTNTSNVCSQELCAENEALRQECEQFLQDCLEASTSDDECVGAAWVKCNG
jgi:hypothetical protein